MPGEIFYRLRNDCRKVRLHFPLTFSLSWLLNLSSPSNAFIKLPVFKIILSQKSSPQKTINLFILSSSMTWSFNLSCISVSKKGNGVLCHFKDKRNFIDFIFLSKWRREMGDYWSFLTQYLIKITHKPLLVPLTIFSRQGWVLVWASKLWWTFLEAETVQLQVDFLWVIYHVKI